LCSEFAHNGWKWQSFVGEEFEFDAGVTEVGEFEFDASVTTVGELECASVTAVAWVESLEECAWDVYIYCGSCGGRRYRWRQQCADESGCSTFACD
jgi:hypothetical protein